MDKLILSIDCGTQSVRCMLYDAGGNLISKVKSKYPPYKNTPNAGICEQDANLYWEKMCEALVELKKNNSEKWAEIAGVTLTCMRDVGVCVDKDMNPLRPVMIWLDTRRAKPAKYPLHARAMFAVSGMTEIAKKKSMDCKSNWIRQNEPEIWAKTDKYIQLSAFLSYKLTGVLSDSIASTIGHIPFNYKKREWFKDGNYMKIMFAVESKRLYPLVSPGDKMGNISENASAETGIAAGLPFIAAGSDKGSETVGTGAVKNDVANVSFGTTATVQITTKNYVEPLKFMPPYPAVYPDRYNPEYIVYRGYWMLTWFVNEFMKEEKTKGGYVEKELDSRLAEIPAGCQGLYVLPHWNPGIKTPEARGAIIGFNNAHTSLHLYRAIIEGINYELIYGLKNLEKNAKTKIRRLTASGGGASSDEILQITADMFGLPVTRVQTFETSGLGAAISGFVGIGVYPDFDGAIAKMVREDKTFIPNAKNHAFYKSFYENVYEDTYKKLKPIYLTLKNIESKE